MPKIRKLQPTASPRGLPTPFEGRPDSIGLQGIGQSIASAGQQVGQALQAREGRAAGEKAGFDAARGSAGAGMGMREMLSLMENDQDGYTRSQGEAALERRDGTLAELDAIAQRQVDATADPKVKEIIRARLEGAILSYQRKVYAHAAGQAQIVKDQSFQVETEQWVEIGEKADTPEDRDAAVSKVGEVAIGRAASEGITDGAVLAKVDRDARGELNRSIVVDLAQSDPAEALDYLQKPTVIETLDDGFIDTQTKIATDNFRTAEAEHLAGAFSEVVDAHGYTDRALAQEILDANNFDGDADLREETQEQFDELVKASERRKRQDINDAYGRAFVATWDAVEGGKAKPLRAVDGNDHDFLTEVNAEGNERWQRLERLARQWKKEKQVKARGGVGRSLGQGIQKAKAYQDINVVSRDFWMQLPPEQVVGTLAEKWGSGLSGSDFFYLTKRISDMQSGVISNDTSDVSADMYEVQARDTGKLPKKRKNDKAGNKLDYFVAQENLREKERVHRANTQAPPTPEQRQAWVVEELVAQQDPNSWVDDAIDFVVDVAKAPGRLVGTVDAKPPDGFGDIPEADIARLRADAVTNGLDEDDDDLILEAWLDEQNGR